MCIRDRLLPSVFGWGRLKYESCPILPLLAGAELPGNVLARFDVLWMGFLLYSLLFSIGSFLYYGHLIVEKADMGTGKLLSLIHIFLAINLFYSSYNKINGDCCLLCLKAEHQMNSNETSCLLYTSRCV